ncbi:hypothetical protein QA584_03030 [Anaerocolumna sp. AGMB13025]|uniref:ABC transporter permease n=1 Tax=Anaerocolumna sp. AGMB13025 TaxID=3039116 RepID=UPI00241DDF55|nr:FtsX-like permease family protein [Anaerocolumna sp. AGMB13025]WFR58051.1 hypothetical protein QA584_03030 [Anaerocolumna sp. AGMB13025]
MKPLSALKQSINNKRKFLIMFLPVLLSIIIVYLIQMFLSSEFRLVERTYVKPQDYYFSIAAKTKVIDNTIINSIMNQKEDYERVFPWVAHYTYFDGLIEKNIGSKVFTVKNEDMKWLIRKMKLKLIAGRLPAAGTNEIILHKTIARNKKLKIGDSIGSSLKKEETIEGKKVIVGLLDGECIVSFDSLEYWMKQYQVEYDDYSTGIIIAPKTDKRKDMEQFLEQIDSQGLDVRTYGSISRQKQKDASNITIIMTVINLMILIMITVCSGFISYINVLHRRSEFGILSAIGYTAEEIMNRLSREIFLVNLAALGFGIMISVLFGGVLNVLFFTQKGIPLILAEPDFMVQAACIPVFVCIFSLVPAWNTLHKLDPVSIIEGLV